MNKELKKLKSLVTEENVYSLRQTNERRSRHADKNRQEQTDNVQTDDETNSIDEEIQINKVELGDVAVTNILHNINSLEINDDNC